MALLEILVVNLGTRLGKILLKSYLKDPAAAMGDELLGIAQGKIKNLLDSKKAARQFEEIGERIAAQLEPLLEREFKNDEASVEAVVLELGKALDGRISAEFFLARDLDPEKLLAELKRVHPLPERQFSQANEQLYDRMLTEAVRYVVEIAAKLPRFEVSQVRESLQRLSRIEDVVGETAKDVRRIRQLVESRESDNYGRQYEIDYRLAVIRNLDYLELFGADLTQESRRQALSVAYVSLTLEATESNREDPAPKPVETLLSGLQKDAGRLLIRGEAGSGKSTLFRWAAIRAARGFPKSKFLDWRVFLGQTAIESYEDGTLLSVPSWRFRIPFLLRLRDCKGGKLPSPDAFPEMIAKEIGAPPAAWVLSILRAGRGLLLFDGLDEIPNHHRDTARQEVTAIVEAYPDNLVLVSTRPEAVPENWLGSLGFREARVNPMSELDRARFIDKWHEAVAVELGKLGKPADDLPRLSRELKQQLPNTPSVARLATNPLLCAMICALHRDRGQKLPETPSELCEYLCEVLLHRREREGGLDLSEFPEAYRKLTYPQKRVIVQEIAHFMVLNEESSITTAQARKKVGEALGRLAGQSEDDAGVVCDSLVERSGMFREAKPGHLDFIHNTFKEYLAAERFANSGDTGRLVKEALSSSWKRVVLFAVATPRRGFAEELVRRLLDRARDMEMPAEKRAYQLVALQCREAALLLDRSLETELLDVTRKLFPPKGLEDAGALATGGDAVVSFLRHDQDLSAEEATACVRTLRLIGTARARAALHGYLDDPRDIVVAELSQAVNPLNIRALQSKLLAGEDLNNGIRSQISDLSPLAALSGLKKLFLHATQVSDLSPLAGLTGLEELDFTRTQVSDLSPLGRLLGLKKLYLGDTQVSDLSPLARFTALQKLDLSETKVTDLAPLAPLRQLKTLYLIGIQVTDLTPLAGLTALEKFFLNGTQVTDLTPLAGFTKLQILSLESTQVANLSPLAGLKNLKTLALTRMPVSDLSPLAGLKALRTLYLTETQVSDLTPLAGIKGLQIVG